MALFDISESVHRLLGGSLERLSSRVHKVSRRTILGVPSELYQVNLVYFFLSIFKWIYIRVMLP